MVKLEKSNENLFVCNSCMKETPYKISATPNGNNGCSICLCKECLENVIRQYNKIDFIDFILNLCDISEKQILNEKIDNNTKFHMRAGLNLLRMKLWKNT